MAKILICVAFLLGPLTAFGKESRSFSQWLQLQTDFALARLDRHFSPEDAIRGVVIASPERGTPDYYYHWVRDGALVMQTVLELKGPRGLQMLHDYATLAKIHQAAIHEPKFHVDGRPFTGEWCRPQNDGPALRAITLTQYANRLLNLNPANSTYVQRELYSNDLPSASVIKVDLEFVAHHWRELTCDLWEETIADHFYTRMVQRRSLVEGAELAQRLGDHHAATFYRQQAREMETEILKHWDESQGLFRAHLNFQAGEEKADGIDGAVVLGLLHGHTQDGFLNFTDTRVLRTVERLADHFKAMYPINHQHPEIPGLGWGRYTSDHFNGARGGYGNPWFLITAAAAQIHFLAAQEWLEHPGHKNQALRYFQLGEAYLKRIRFHAGEQGILDEQFDRHSGFMSSAPDLTWSYKEFLDAMQARRRVMAQLGRKASSTAFICENALIGSIQDISGNTPP